MGISVVCRQEKNYPNIFRRLVISGGRAVYESDTLRLVADEEGFSVVDLRVDDGRAVYARDILDLVAKLGGTWHCYEWDAEHGKEVANYTVSHDQLLLLIKMELKRLRGE